jgi:hypothetical protein
MKARNGKNTKSEPLLNTVAESIGAALGTIAAKADAAQKALTHSNVVRSAEREVKKLARKTKRAARKTVRRSTRAVAKVKRSKVAKAGRRAASAVKRARRSTARRISSR